MYRTSSVHWRNGTDAEGQVERRQGYHHTARTVLKDRLREDRGTIIQPGQLNTTKPVGVYFGQQGHDYTNLRMIPLEQIRSRDPMDLIKRFNESDQEIQWIRSKDPMDPIKRSNGSDQEIQWIRSRDPMDPIKRSNGS